MALIRFTSLDSPIGLLTVAAARDRVCLLHFGPDVPAVRATLARWYPGHEIDQHSDPAGVVGVLQRYFSGEVRAIDDVEVELNGTAFQQRVWHALRSIPSGTTVSYGHLARTIGAESAVRAVGAANGANPVAIIVPCHRVIGSNGSLTGYGGGLDRKRWLLRHEGARPTEPLLDLVSGPSSVNSL